MKQLEVVAVLLNGGHIVWSQPSVPGKSVYRVYLPDVDGVPTFVGRITDSMAESLWCAGFFKARSGGKVDKYGVRHMVLYLDKPSLAFLDPPADQIATDSADDCLVVVDDVEVF